MTTELHLSHLQLDALAMGALAAETRASAERHLANCARCRGEQECLLDLRREALGAAPRGLERIRAARRPAWTRWVQLAGPAFALAAAAWVVLTPTNAPVEPDFAVKGPEVLEAWVRRGDVSEPVRDGDSLAPGDSVRLAVSPSAHPFLLVVSLDGAGNVTAYFPFNGTRSAPLPPAEAGGKLLLPGSLELDDALGTETLWALYSDEPLELKEVSALIAGARRVDHPAVKAQATLQFTKAPRGR